MEHGGNSDNYKFVIPMQTCGTDLKTKRYQTQSPHPYKIKSKQYLRSEIETAENVIIVQMDPLVQEIWDSARRISCTWDDLYQKSIRSVTETLKILFTPTSV